MGNGPEYREFGQTGQRISRLGLGAMRLPQANGRVDLDAAVRLIRHALDAGINVLDTAHVYAGSEEAIGRAIADRERASFLLMTKAPPASAPGAIRRCLETSLARLGTQYVDFFLAHDARADRADALRVFLDEAHRAQEEGLVRHVGFSSHDTPAGILRLIDMDAFECMLVQYSLLDTSNRVPMHYARLKGLGVAVMGPLAGGRLLAPSEATRAYGDAGRWGIWPALRFVTAIPDLHVAFSGMQTAEQIDENLAIADDHEPLSDEERRQIELTAAERRNLSDLYCTGCGYCMPCPNGVNVPEVFRLAQYVRLYGLREYASRLYAAQVQLGQGADHCYRCGDCDAKCPQELRIADLLADSHKLLGGKTLNSM